jgi:hypothetical protein
MLTNISTLTLDPNERNDLTFIQDDADELEDAHSKSSDRILTLDENAGHIDNILNAN